MNSIEAAILKHILQHGPSTQGALTTVTERDQSTVSRRVSNLTQRGLLRHIGANKGYGLVKSPEDTVREVTAPLLEEAREWAGLLE